MHAYRFPNSLCNQQGIKLQILNCVQGRSSPPLLLQQPPLSLPHFPFPTTQGIPLALPSGRPMGSLGPTPREIWRPLHTPPAAVTAR